MKNCFFSNNGDQLYFMPVRRVFVYLSVSSSPFGIVPKLIMHANFFSHSFSILQLTHKHTLSLYLTHTHTHSLFLSLKHTHTHNHSLSLYLTHTHNHSFSLSHTHSLTYTHTHTLYLTHITHTHTHTRTQAHTFSCRYTLPLLSQNFPKQYFFSHPKNNIQRSSCNILIFILCLHAFAAHKHLTEKKQTNQNIANE